MGIAKDERGSRKTFDPFSPRGITAQASTGRPSASAPPIPLPQPSTPPALLPPPRRRYGVAGCQESAAFAERRSCGRPRLSRLKRLIKILNATGARFDDLRVLDGFLDVLLIDTDSSVHVGAPRTKWFEERACDCVALLKMTHDTQAAAGNPGEVHEIIITSADKLHVIRHVGNVQAVLQLTLDRRQATLGLARIVLDEAAAAVVVAGQRLGVGTNPQEILNGQ